MFPFSKPSPDRVRRYYERQQKLSVTSGPLGLSQHPPPRGFEQDAATSLLGSGPDTFASAREDLRTWKQFDVNWVQIHPAYPPIAVGETVVVVAKMFGIWSLNACRILQVHDDPQRFGFIYGTLPGHSEVGEEEFVIEHHADNRVTFRIQAVFRPRWWPVKLGWKIIKPQTDRFRQMAVSAMKHAC